MVLEQKCCKWCDKPRANYSCPKCAAPYCSLKCYRDKRHEGCTETFYKGQVEESIKAQTADDETKREMQRLVQRYHDQVDLGAIDTDELDVGSDESGDEEVSLVERLDGIDLGSELDDTTAMAVWSRLTEEECAGFVDLLSGRNIDSVIKPWQPWWCRATEPMIAPVDDTGTSARGATDGSAAVPPILAIGAPVQSLARKVHPSVLFQLAQLSLAYVYTLRHLNGETHGSNLAAAFTSLESVAPLLSAAVADMYQSAHEALIVGFSGIDESMDGYAKCSLLDDILAIYADHTHVAAMVSDIYRIVTDILGTRVSSAGSPARARVKRGEKRIFFLASIVKQMQGEADPWQFMAIDVAMLKRRYASGIQILESGSPTAPEPAENASDQAGGAEAKPQIQAL